MTPMIKDYFLISNNLLSNLNGTGASHGWTYKYYQFKDSLKKFIAELSTPYTLETF